MIEFNPCPSCSSIDDLVIVQHATSSKYRYTISCSHCGFSTSNAYFSLTTLKAIWNAL